MGERARSLKLLRSVEPGMLLMWDRGLLVLAMVQASLAKGCDYLGRIPALRQVLSRRPARLDGSYLRSDLPI